MNKHTNRTKVKEHNHTEYFSFQKSHNTEENSVYVHVC